MSTNATELLRQQAKIAHDILEATMADVTPEQAHWTPPSIANPLGATYAHLVVSEDFVINGMFRQQAPLLAGAWSERTGLSSPMPTFLASLNDDALGRPLDLSGVGLGQQTVASALTLLMLNHIGTETGEIACLKGVQGARGYPF